jgi:hypothetical protein
MAGLFPDEYMLKFVLDDVKLEFFQANRPIQKKILSTATFSHFENSKLKILDVKSVAKLKLVALILTFSAKLLETCIFHSLVILLV